MNMLFFIGGFYVIWKIIGLIWALEIDGSDIVVMVCFNKLTLW